MDPLLSIPSILGYWAIILGTSEALMFQALAMLRAPAPLEPWDLTEVER